MSVESLAHVQGCTNHCGECLYLQYVHVGGKRSVCRVTDTQLSSASTLNVTQKIKLKVIYTCICTCNSYLMAFTVYGICTARAVCTSKGEARGSTYSTRTVLSHAL